MKRKNNTITEEIDRIKNLIGFDFSYNLLKEAEEKTEFFEFGHSYPDNIAFPVTKGSGVKNYSTVLKHLTPDVKDFITRLQRKIKQGSTVDKIKIKSGSSPDTPTRDAPTGWTPELVEYSYKGEDGNIKLSNAVLAKNRAKGMMFILKKKLGLTDDNFIIDSSGTEKTVKVGIPTTTLINFNKLKDYKLPTKIYDPKVQPPTLPITKCNASVKATGSGGKAPHYIADRMKLDFTGNGKVTFTYNSYAIPDRFKIMKTRDNKSYTTIADTGFVTDLSPSDELFNPIKEELKILFPQQQLKSGKGSGKLEFDKEEGYQYIINVIAPFGGTVWEGKLTCGDMKNTSQDKSPEESNIKPIDWYDLPTNKDGKYYTSNPDNTFNLYFKGKLNSKGLQWEGTRYEYKNGKEVAHTIKNGKEV